MKRTLIVLLMLMGGNAYAVANYVGTDNQNVTLTNVATTTVSGTVQTVSTSTRINDGVDSLNINADGSIPTTVSPSTQTIRGRNGNTVTSHNFSASTEALHVLNLGQPNLYGVGVVYASSDNMVTSGLLTLAAKIKSIDLTAMNADCSFNINSGDTFVVSKNTSEGYLFDYAIQTASVTLVAKQAAATCKVRIFGAN